MAIAIDIAAGSGALSALVTTIDVIFTLRNQTKINAVHHEVETLNGKTIGKLLDNAEGRRIAEEVPRNEQTASDRHYVDNVEASDAGTAT